MKELLLVISSFWWFCGLHETRNLFPGGNLGLEWSKLIIALSCLIDLFKSNYVATSFLIYLESKFKIFVNSADNFDHLVWSISKILWNYQNFCPHQKKRFTFFLEMKKWLKLQITFVWFFRQFNLFDLIDWYNLLYSNEFIERLLNWTLLAK